MNIKSLLFGSAAALVAVSGARAADAVVVAEPEPAEYVKICDVYGAGYYYIPGTETCLNIGGYVRVTVGAGGGALGGYWGHQDVVDKGDVLNSRPRGLNDTWSWASRANVHLDARSETEYGTLRSYLEFQFDRASIGGTNASGADATADSETTLKTSLEQAYIQLAGLTIGYTNSFFGTITESAGGNVMADDIVGYAPGHTNLIAYTFDGGTGFSATIALEQGNGAPTYGWTRNSTIDSYTPHVVVGASYTQGWGSIEGVVGYDSNYSEWAGKLRVNVNINDQLSAWVMGGLASGNDSLDEMANHYNSWHGDWAVWGGLDYKFNEKGTLYGQLSYTNGNDGWSASASNFSNTRYTKDVWGAVVGVKYNLVPGFYIKPEVNFASAKRLSDGDRDTSWGAAIRFQRSF
jgi:hypothetical protein